MMDFDSKMQMLSVTEKMNICKNSCTAKNCKNVSILVSMLSKQQPYVLLKRLDIDRPIAKVKKNIDIDNPVKTYSSSAAVDEDTELSTATHDAANYLKDRLLKKRHVNRFGRKLSAGCTFLKQKSSAQKEERVVRSTKKTKMI